MVKKVSASKKAVVEAGAAVEVEQKKAKSAAIAV